MLPGVCPGCGLRADLDVFSAQADVNKALASALEFPAPLGGRVLAYLRLFSPPSKTLALGKATRLLTELAETVKAAQVRRHGIDYAAPLALWEAALDAILASPPESLPLANHGYLFQIAWNLAEKAAARAERVAEERSRRGAALTALAESPPSAPEPTAPTERAERVPPPPEFKALLAQLKGRHALPQPPGNDNVL